MPEWKEQPFSEFAPPYIKEFALAGKVGRVDGMSNAAQMACKYHYNGSGPMAFGGASRWPVVKSRW